MTTLSRNATNGERFCNSLNNSSATMEAMLAGYAVYDKPEDFEEKLSDHLERLILERLNQPAAAPPVPITPPTIHVHAPAAAQPVAWAFEDLQSNRGWLAEAVQIEQQPVYRKDGISRLLSEQWAKAICACPTGCSIWPSGSGAGVARRKRWSPASSSP